MQCIFCKKEFESTRLDAKFCSSKCQVYYRRNIKPNTGELENIEIKKSPIIAPKKDTQIKIQKKVINGNTKLCPKHKVFWLTCGCTPLQKD